MRHLMLFPRIGLACLMALLLAAAPQASVAAEPLRVAIYDHSGGKAHAPHTLQKVLTGADGFRPQTVSPEAIRRGCLRDFDVLIMPGGSASRQPATSARRAVRPSGNSSTTAAGTSASVQGRTWRLPIIPGRWAC